MHAGAQLDNDWAAPLAAGPVHASVSLPGSKSMTNRALVIAALADGPTTIVGPLQARDTDLMAAAITALGATVTRGGSSPDHPAPGDRDTWLVTPGHIAGPAHVDVGNAGTVMRFVPPVAALARADVEFTGDERAAQRPIAPLLDALRQLGADIADGGRGSMPFVVRGRGEMDGGRVTLDASSSSQLISGLMIAAPRYHAGAEIRHEGGQLPSAPHIAMTAAMLVAAGAHVETGNAGPSADPDAPNFWRVRPGRLVPGRIEIEPDLSNAAPFLAAALITGGQVTMAGWPDRSLQAAGQILGVLGQMGATCTMTPAGLQVKGTGRISGIRADLRDVNELAPVVTALAAVADSPSELTGIGHMRLHESDRLAALAHEFGALGGQVTELSDGLRIDPRPLRAAQVPFDSHDDHRLVMAAAVLGLVVPGLRVNNAATVGKTFPAFGELWQQMLERPS
jgi:3-phosphoshikimate 1-carboxyvinyltransferase